MLDQAIAVTDGQAGQGVEVDAKERLGVRERRGLELAELRPDWGLDELSRYVRPRRQSAQHQASVTGSIA